MKFNIKTCAFCPHLFAGIPESQESDQPLHTLTCITTETHLMPDSVERFGKCVIGTTPTQVGCTHIAGLRESFQLGTHLIWRQPHCACYVRRRQAFVCFTTHTHNV